MSPSYLHIYLIFFLFITLTQVKYGILQLDGTTRASQQIGTTAEAFLLQLNGTTEMSPSPLDGASKASPQNGTTAEAFHLQVSGTTETLQSPLNGTTNASPQNGTTAEAFHLQVSGTTKTLQSPLEAHTKASQQNLTTSEAFHFQLNGTTEMFPSPLDATTFPSQHRAPGATEPLDTTTEDPWVSFSKYVPSENCTSQFCSCEDFEKLGDVFCHDYETELYWKYLSIKIGYDDPYSSRFALPVPPPESPGFRIKYLGVNDPKVDLDENSLEGVLVLEELHVIQSGLLIIPDFRFVKDSIRKIKIEQSHLAALEGGHLQNLTSVRHFSFAHNAIQHIAPDVFQGTENVEYLDLSYNLLTSLPQRLLDRMRNLNTFVASHNHLLHVKGVFYAILPKVILLDFNNLTSASDVLEYTNDRYEKLRYTRMELRHYLRFWEVIRLDLSNNHITETDLTDEFSKYKINGIPIYGIEQVQLEGNQLRNLNTILKWCRVVEFQASRNRLEALYSEDFSMMHDTVDLRLRDNEIRRVDPDAFQPIRSTLQRLDLSRNSIRDLGGSVRYLSELKKLDVSHNAIQSFSQDEFMGLHALLELYLHHNQIRMLAMLQHLSRLGTLGISHNQIQLIRPQQLPPSLHDRTALSLGDNPFKCDCRLQPLTDWARGRDEYGDFIATSSELCLRSDRGNRTQESEECPEFCTCSCRDDSMFVDCSSKSLFAVPHFLRKDAFKDKKTAGSDMSYPLVFRQNRNLSLHFEDRVTGISLENNSLESLDGASLPPNLTRLYLAHNRLRRLPESLLDDPPELKQVSLSGNPWICDCSTVTFKKWLTSNHFIFRDLDAIRCGADERGSVARRAVWQLTDLDLCPSSPVRLIVSVALGILTFIIVCLSAKVLFTRYELNIRVFLYYHGFTFAREEQLDQDKAFDVFVSFSHADDEFVIQDIISVIERKDPDIRLCLHYRHFTAGEFILDNITRAVHSSKRTLLILTRNFVESEWCLQEFRTAHRQAMEDKVHRIIAVKVGELPKEIDHTLQVYLDCTTYLVWGELNFWNKLLFVLPTRSPTEDNKNVIEESSYV